MDRAYAASSGILSALVALIGLAMLISTLARGGGLLDVGVIVGACFTVLGCARIWLARNPPTDSGR